MPKKVSKAETPRAHADGSPSREIAEIWQAMQNMETAHTVEKKKILSMSEISLILDSYDDIFSKFDPRPYSERGLSGDFLTEIKKGCKDKTSGQIELTFLVPSALKDRQRELIIEERLKHHFQKHHDMLKKEIWEVRKWGGLQVLIGVGMSVITAMLALADSQTFMNRFALIVFEPASWFVMWMGFEDIFRSWHRHKEDICFYKRMTEAKISFLPY